MCTVSVTRNLWKWCANYQYLCSIPYHSAPQTEAKSVPHPEWEKMVYFMCSSLDMKEMAAGSAWSTQKELLTEAELEVQVLKQLVQDTFASSFLKVKLLLQGRPHLTWLCLSWTWAPCASCSPPDWQWVFVCYYLGKNYTRHSATSYTLFLSPLISPHFSF